MNKFWIFIIFLVVALIGVALGLAVGYTTHIIYINSTNSSLNTSILCYQGLPGFNGTNAYNNTIYQNTTEIDPVWNSNYSIFLGLINNASYLSTFNSTYNNILNQNCPSGQFVNGTYLNGTFKCTTNSNYIGNYTDIALTNQTNTFNANQGFNGSLNVNVSVGNAFVGGSGLLLQNPTATDAVTTFRFSPALIQSVQGLGTSNQQFQWASVLNSNAAVNTSVFRYWYKFGNGAWTVHPFYLDTANGFVILATALGEDITEAPNVFLLGNTAAATSTVDQYTPPIKWYSTAWKTATTAAYQYVSMLNLNAPEKGYLSPIGVHKWVYGINSLNPTETNELMRLQWGSDSNVTGAFFNDKSLNNYTFRVEGALDENLFNINGTSDNIGIGMGNPLNKLDVNGTINTLTNFSVKGIQGITANITIMKTAVTTCDMNFTGGILYSSDC